MTGVFVQTLEYIADILQSYSRRLVHISYIQFRASIH